MSQPALTWTATGTPVSTRFADPYFTDGAGLDEARHVFLHGNGLPERLRDGFHVAELGFGTGLNLLALLSAWDGPGRLSCTGFEAFPITADEMAQALTPFDLPQAAELITAWRGSSGRVRQFCLTRAEVTVIVGDARETLPAWQGRAEAWFLDGFAPARNPELWEPGLMAEVARHTAPGGTFATYTAAGAVRRALAEAGFSVGRRAGFGAKRHMSAGRLEAP
jgi:tRNA U34 5-methylaminomethyl-2-thiouridine-forming methyltransferase MnmC